MSTTAPVPTSNPLRAGSHRPLLRPLALPTEHGGWGFLFEPIVLGLVVAPSAAGLLIAFAAVAGFLARQPLKYAMQDALRGRSYPRTRWCWSFAVSYGVLAALFVAAAVFVSSLSVLVPFAVVAPLAIVTIVYDAKNRSRSLFPELTGAAAMSSTAAAIAIAGHAGVMTAAALSAIIVARSLPAIAYVRTLLVRAHGRSAASWPALLAHVVAAAGVAIFAPLSSVIAMVILLLRAIWRLSVPPAPAKTIGWSEIAFGILTVGIVAIGYV